MYCSKNYFTIFLLACSLTQTNSASENNLQIIPIDKGLLTELKTNYVNWTVQRCNNTGIQYFMGKNYFSGQDILIRSLNHVSTNFFPTIVLQRKTDHSLSLLNCGSLNYRNRSEFKEACRMNQAVYIPYNQGIFVYTLAGTIDTESLQNGMKTLQDLADINTKHPILPFK